MSIKIFLPIILCSTMLASPTSCPRRTYNHLRASASTLVCPAREGTQQFLEHLTKNVAHWTTTHIEYATPLLNNIEPHLSQLEQLIGMSITASELSHHNIPQPYITAIMTWLAGTIGQNALARHNPRNLQRSRVVKILESIMAGALSGIVVRTSTHLFFCVFPESAAGGTAFLLLSVALAPKIIGGISQFTGALAQRFWNSCRGCCRRRRPVQETVFAGVGVHAVNGPDECHIEIGQAIEPD